MTDLSKMADVRRSFVLPIACACFSIGTHLFGLAQEQIQWGALLCTPPEIAVEGVQATRVESCKPKKADLQEPCSPPAEQYTMPAKMSMRTKVLKCLCAKTRFRFRRYRARRCRPRQ